MQSESLCLWVDKRRILMTSDWTVWLDRLWNGETNRRVSSLSSLASPMECWNGGSKPVPGPLCTTAKVNKMSSTHCERWGAGGGGRREAGGSQQRLSPKAECKSCTVLSFHSRSGSCLLWSVSQFWDGSLCCFCGPLPLYVFSPYLQRRDEWGSALNISPPTPSARGSTRAILCSSMLEWNMMTSSLENAACQTELPCTGLWMRALFSTVIGTLWTSQK